MCYSNLTDGYTAFPPHTPTETSYNEEVEPLQKNGFNHKPLQAAAYLVPKA